MWVEVAPRAGTMPGPQCCDTPSLSSRHTHSPVCLQGPHQAGRQGSLHICRGCCGGTCRTPCPGKRVNRAPRWLPPTLCSWAGRRALQGPPETNVQNTLCPLLGPLNRCGKRGPVPSCGRGSRCPQEACMGRGTSLSNGVRPGCWHGVTGRPAPQPQQGSPHPPKASYGKAEQGRHCAVGRGRGATGGLRRPSF